jgi:hypothetical protein
MERGEGFNEFDKQQGIVRIFVGFSGNNRRIDISYSIDDVKAIRVELKDGLLLDEQSIFVFNEIPLTQPMTLKNTTLANFLQKIYY